MNRPYKPEIKEISELHESEQIFDDSPSPILEICTKPLMPAVEAEPNLRQLRLMAMSMLEAFERDEDFKVEVDDRVLN